LESLILDRATGALSKEEDAALQAHLDGCPACRAWLASCEEAVQLARLPEPAEAEARIFAHLPVRTAVAFRERRSNRGSWGRPMLSAAFGAAVVAAVMLVGGPRWGAHAGPKAERAGAATA